jgi:hypothetical protein
MLREMRRKQRPLKSVMTVFSMTDARFHGPGSPMQQSHQAGFLGHKRRILPHTQGVVDRDFRVSGLSEQHGAASCDQWQGRTRLARDFRGFGALRKS